MKDSSFFETSPANSLRQSLGRVGQWFRLDGMILVLPDNEVEPDHEMSAMVSRGARRLPSRRILAYTTKDVIDNRISVPAQHSLVRLSKNPVTNADAVGMLDEIKAGRLAGIFCVNWKIPAQRALLLDSSWWTVIPPGEDAVVMLDPKNPVRGQPLIAFRRELDPDCGLLQGEQRFAASPSRIDAALLKGWATYRLIKAGKVSRCTSSDGTVQAENTLNGVRLRNVVPQIVCAKGAVTVSTSRPVTGCRYEPNEREEAKRSPGEVEPLFPGPRVLESALLFDFAVGSSIPKIMHEDYFIRIIAANDLANPKSRVRVALIEGFSDCVDSEEVNVALRFRRAEAVAFRLSQLGVHPKNLAEFRGASRGEIPGDDSTQKGRARNRSVTVLLEQRRPRRVRPPRSTDPLTGKKSCPGSTRFSVRLLSSGGVSKPGLTAGPAGGFLRFEIVDLECRRAQEFILVAGGASVGAPGSANAVPSEEKFFRTEQPTFFQDFEGPGLWASGAVQFGIGPSTDGLAIPHLIMYWYSANLGGLSRSQQGIGIGGGVAVLAGIVSRTGKEQARGSGSLPHNPSLGRRKTQPR